jgi:hypothetical protein
MRKPNAGEQGGYLLALSGLISLLAIVVPVLADPKPMGVYALAAGAFVLAVAVLVRAFRLHDRVPALVAIGAIVLAMAAVPTYLLLNDHGNNRHRAITEPSPIATASDEPVASPSASPSEPAKHEERNKANGLVLNEYYGLDLDADTRNFGLAPYVTGGLDIIVDNNEIYAPEQGSEPRRPEIGTATEVSYEACAYPDSLNPDLKVESIKRGMKLCVLTSGGRVAALTVKDVKITTSGAIGSVTVDAVSWS